MPMTHVLQKQRGHGVDYDVTILKGGWDQVTPTLSLSPGAIRDGVNFECSITGGYSRVGGYERYDGQDSPSAATYTIVEVASMLSTPSAGDTLTGFTSGATGVIVEVVASLNYMVLTKVVGTFSSGEVLKVGATGIGIQTATTATITALLNAQYLNLAADEYRGDITAVPGSGPVRGVAGLVVNGVDHLYAWRDNAGATATIMWEDSAAGWIQVALPYEVTFTSLGTTGLTLAGTDVLDISSGYYNATSPLTVSENASLTVEATGTLLVETAGSFAIPQDGDTLTQSGVTSVIKRVVLESGSWAAGTAAGRFVISTPVGNFAAGSAVAGSTPVTLSGIQTAITLLPGGKFETVQANFFGQASGLRLYGVDGVNRMFEFDGTTYVPISTGADDDAPTHLTEHKAQLFASIGSSAMHSGPGTPYQFEAIDGGSEIPTGDTITAFLPAPGSQTTGTLFIFGSTITSVLYGVDVSTWNLTKFNIGNGARAYTAQNLDQAYAYDDGGLAQLAATLSYGNFSTSKLTYPISTFVAEKSTGVAYSAVHQLKSQYRIFFDDGYALYSTIKNGKLVGNAQVVFPDIVYCAKNVDKSSGGKTSYFGAASGGYVFELDKGSSFDGADINAYITLNWNAMRSPRVHKRFRRASAEIQGNYYASLSVGYQLGYASTELLQASNVAYATSFTLAPAWDNFTWDAFTWDGTTLSPTEIQVKGTAENIQYTFSSGTDYIYPFTINSVITHYTPRRGLR